MVHFIVGAIAAGFVVSGLIIGFVLILEGIKKHLDK
jgi:hypothetical protein